MDNPKNLLQLSQQHPIILYDGECFLCDHSVQFILKRDRHTVFRFCTLQDAIKYSDLSNLLDLTSKNSVILIYKGLIYDKSDAAIHTMRLIGGWLSWLGSVAYIVPKFIRNTVYNFIAKNRYTWFGKSDTCLMPNPTYTSQFLNLELER
jgi:predicted DCC family thiol-disulfide oxidoreductase YuxK